MYSKPLESASGTGVGFCDVVDFCGSVCIQGGGAIDNQQIPVRCCQYHDLMPDSYLTAASCEQRCFHAFGAEFQVILRLAGHLFYRSSSYESAAELPTISSWP